MSQWGKVAPEAQPLRLFFGLHMSVHVHAHHTCICRHSYTPHIITFTTVIPQEIIGTHLQMGRLFGPGSVCFIHLDPCDLAIHGSPHLSPCSSLLPNTPATPKCLSALQKHSQISRANLTLGFRPSSSCSLSCNPSSPQKARWHCKPISQSSHVLSPRVFYGPPSPCVRAATWV